LLVVSDCTGNGLPRQQEGNLLKFIILFP
jgi:hypothetical protein